MRALAIQSVPFIIISGQIPAEASRRQQTASIISMLESGIAIRFVMRKYTGKVPNFSQTRGAVKSWHEIESEAMSHIFFVTEKPAGAGYHDFILGKTKVIPAIARYDSWNPADENTDGFSISCMVSAAQSISAGLCGRFSSREVSRSSMNRKALTIDGEAPVAIAYVPETPMIIRNLIRRAAGLKPIIVVVHRSIM